MAILIDLFQIKLERIAGLINNTTLKGNQGPWKNPAAVCGSRFHLSLLR